MAKNERDFAEMVAINKYKLDEECLRHASDYYYIAEKLAQARAQADAVADRLSVVLAEANIKVRREAELSGLKVTEGLVASHVEISSDVISCRVALQEAKATQYSLDAGVKAWEHRKSQLDNLVQLFIRAYYSNPAENGAPEGAIEKTVKRDVRERLNRKAV
jgi:hypothetical protein